MIIRLITIVLLFTATVSAMTLEEFQPEATPLIQETVQPDVKASELSNLIVYLTEIINRQDADFTVVLYATYFRADAYIKLVKNGYGKPEYINNAKQDVAACLAMDKFFSECYLGAMEIYLYEGNADMAKKSYDAVAFNERFVQDMNMFTGQTMDVDTYTLYYSNMLKSAGVN